MFGVSVGGLGFKFHALKILLHIMGDFRHYPLRRWSNDFWHVVVIEAAGDKGCLEFWHFKGFFPGDRRKGVCWI